MLLFLIRLIYSNHLRHGGKVAAVALALTGIIIYTYYESGKSKTSVEEGLNGRMVVEPYEVRTYVQLHF